MEETIILIKITITTKEIEIVTPIAVAPDPWHALGISAISFLLIIIMSEGNCKKKQNR